MSLQDKTYTVGEQRDDSSQIKIERHWLVIIIITAVLLRVAAAFFLGNRVVELPGTFDQLSYDMLAQRVMNGYGFTVAEDWWPATSAGEPTAHWSYLYVLYLTIIYSLFGYSPLVARLIQAILAGLVMPLLAYRLGSHYFSRTVGLTAAALTAVYTYFVYYAGALMTETFYVIAIMWILDIAGQIGRAKSRNSKTKVMVQTLLFSIAIATAVLLRQVVLLFIPFLFAWLLWRSYRKQSLPLIQMFGVLVTATIVLVLAIAPWTLRNYRAFDQFVLLNTNAGFAFFWGNHPIHGYNFVSILPPDGPSYIDLIPPELLELNEAELDRALLKRGLAFIRAEPGRYLILSVSRLKDYFKFWPSSESSFISNLSRILSFGLLWPFMLFGFIYSLRRSSLSNSLILHLFVIIYTTVHLLSWALIRYRLPVDAVLLVFAGVAFVKAYTWLTRRHPTSFRSVPTSNLIRPGE